MNRGAILIGLAGIMLLVCAACSSPGRATGAGPEVSPPDEIVDFKALYSQNCAGCHGSGGRDGAAIALSDPVFLAIADDATIRRTAAGGVRGTPMPAFAQSAGGMLTDEQIDALVRGIRSWAKPNAFRQETLPSYAALTAGDPRRGADVYRAYCSSCHGADGRGGKDGSIVDGSYLALASDQNLRLNVILGRPSEGSPDWRNDIPGKALSEQEIADVVAWLVAQRPATPGRPYPSSTIKPAAGGSR